MYKTLARFDLFAALDDAALVAISKICRLVHYKKGAVLFLEKAQPNALLLLSEGILKVYKTDLKNSAFVLHRFSPYSVIAEMPTLEQIPYPASASFESDGAVISIDYQKFQALISAQPELSMGMVRSLSKKIKGLEQVIELNLVLDSTSRLAKYLCDHRNTLMTLKQYQIADELHMTPETLSRIFKRLTTMHLITKNSEGIVIVNEAGLRLLFEA